MNHSTLPIYHLAMLRGFLLAMKADHEVFEAAEALYSAAVRGRAALDTLEDMAPDPQVTTGELKVEAIIPEVTPPTAMKLKGKDWHPFLNDTMSDRALFEADRQKEEMQEAMTANNDIDPSWTDAGVMLKPEPVYDTVLPVIRSYVSIDDKNTYLPAGVKASDAWPAALIWTVFREREKKPASKWEAIAELTGRARFSIQKKYSMMKLSGELELLREAQALMAPIEPQKLQDEFELIDDDEESAPASILENSGDPHFESFWNDFPPQRRGSKDKAFIAWRKALGKVTTPSVILLAVKRYACSTYVSQGLGGVAALWLDDEYWNTIYYPAATSTENEYIGKRIELALTDADWPDIRYRHVKLNHSNTSIAGDYDVTEQQMDTYIRMQKRKEAALEAEMLGEAKELAL